MRVNILGTDYEIILDADPKKDKNMIDNDGYCDHSVRKIVVSKLEQDDNSLEDLVDYGKKVLRHEIIHAFLCESGLRECSGRAGAWAQNEEMVDWIAVQAPKIFEAFRQCNCI
ncbi:MAG: hypothetical protein PHV18_05165 [Lachnospiraceae bacterium]|nr:hypothetical protein [Lachnospiraceae bacterium]